MLQLSDIPELDALEVSDLTEAGIPCDASPGFTLPANRYRVHKSKAWDKRRRRGIKRMIRPENASELVKLLPTRPDDRLHCVLRGDFVLCDIIPRIIGARGRCPHLRIATLGMSAANASTLADLQARGDIKDFTLVVSHYFESVDRASTYREVRAILEGRARFIVTRSHAKVILLPTDGGDFFAAEGSANLRSSDNLEQMLFVNDRETHDFHASWIDDLASRHCP